MQKTLGSISGKALTQYKAPSFVPESPGKGSIEESGMLVSEAL